MWGGGAVVGLCPPGRVNAELGGGERTKRGGTAHTQKVVKMYAFRGLGDASDANDAESCIKLSITKCSGDY